MGVADLFRRAGLDLTAGPLALPDAQGGEVCLRLDPRTLSVAVPAGCTQRLVVVHEAAQAATLDLQVGAGATLELVELFGGEAFVECRIRQAEGSLCRVTVAELASANVNYTIDLDGPRAESDLGGVFLAAGEEHCEVGVRVNHNVPDCRSVSLVKGVASGRATGEFRGLVYVAPDAQRTDAQQTSRNVVLSDEARIVTRPQLEIYADDVRCSHGATVGLLDDEAILYMRQRGLSEAQARRLQMEGFVGQVADRCASEPLREVLTAAVADKLNRL